MATVVLIDNAFDEHLAQGADTHVTLTYTDNDFPCTVHLPLSVEKCWLG